MSKEQTPASNAGSVDDSSLIMQMLLHHYPAYPVEQKEKVLAYVTQLKAENEFLEECNANQRKIILGLLVEGDAQEKEIKHLSKQYLELHEETTKLENNTKNTGNIL